MLAWYFGTANKKLRYNDNREIIIGKMHTVKGDPVICQHGLHGSERLIDALSYAPGPMLYRVDITRRIAQQKDKIAGQRRLYLAGFDATLLLQEFARKQALINIDRIKPYINNSNYQIIIDWLHTGDKSVKEAARAVAEAAADDMLTNMVIAELNKQGEV